MSVTRRTFIRAAGSMVGAVVVGCDRAVTGLNETGPPSFAAAATADNFIVAGQSNAAGAFSAPNVYSQPSLVPQLFKANALDAGWTELLDHTNDASNPEKGSCWPLFSTRHMKARHVPTAIVTSAIPGGLVATNGTPNATVWAAGNPSFVRCIDAVARSGITSAAAILWFQGEKEASSQGLFSESEYYEALLAMRDGLEAGFGFAVPMIVGQTGNRYETETPLLAGNLNGVRRVQARLWETPGFYAGPVTCDLDHSSTNPVHFTDPAHAVILARRWWYHTEVALFGASGGRGPRFLGANQAGRRALDVTFSVANGGLHLGTRPTVGWRVTDSRDPWLPLTVRRAELDGSTVRLALSRPLVGAFRVAWGYCNDAGGATARDAHNLPMEPFEHSA